jgi:hypothetical protein
MVLAFAIDPTLELVDVFLLLIYLLEFLVFIKVLPVFCVLFYVRQHLVATRGH